MEGRKTVEASNCLLPFIHCLPAKVGGLRNGKRGGQDQLSLAMKLFRKVGPSEAHPKSLSNEWWKSFTSRNCHMQPFFVCSATPHKLQQPS